MRTFYLFVLLIFSAILLAVLLDIFVYTDDIYYYAFSDTLSGERIDELIAGMKDFAWIGYTLIPFIYGLKIFLVSASIYTGIFLLNIRASFSVIFHTVLKCEFIFLIPVALRLFWFSFINTSYTLEDIDIFPPFSILAFFELTDTEIWVTYALSFINLIQIAYIILMSKGISSVLDINFGESFELLIKSYGAALILWILFVVFLIVSLT